MTKFAKAPAVKKDALYAVDVLSNTVVVTKKFLESANTMKGDEYDLFVQFKEMGFNIVQRTRKPSTPKKETNSPLRPLKPVEEKKPLIPFKKMALYISLLDDADEMMDKFDAIRKDAQTKTSPRKYVNEWFREQFPNYEKIAQLDEENRIIHKNVAKSDAVIKNIA